MLDNNRYVTFTLGGMLFEYDEEKNQKNIKNHGISFKSAARVFFDYDRIEYYDEKHSDDEERFDTIGDLSAGNVGLKAIEGDMVIGNVGNLFQDEEDVLFVVYTERVYITKDDKENEVIRLISARYATNFERGLYYGKC